MSLAAFGAYNAFKMSEAKAAAGAAAARKKYGADTGGILPGSGKDKAGESLELLGVGGSSSSSSSSSASSLSLSSSSMSMSMSSNPQSGGTPRFGSSSSPSSPSSSSLSSAATKA